MEIQIKVPNWVNTDDEGICMLFAFLRRIAIEYDIPNGMDVYGSDIRKIMNSKDNAIHDTINESIDMEQCSIAKLTGEHFIFTMRNYRRDIRVVTIKKLENLVIWAYLSGCSNYNLIERDSNSIIKENRPHYTPMYRLDRDMFMLSFDE